MKANNVNSKPSVFTLDDNTSFNNGSPNSIGSPSRDVNLNHLNMVSPSTTSPRSPSAHSNQQQSQGFSLSSPSNSPTREIPDTLQMSPSSQKSIVHVKEKAKDERYVIESTIEMVKNEEFVLKKSPEKEFNMERSSKEVSSHSFELNFGINNENSILASRG